MGLLDIFGARKNSPDYWNDMYRAELDSGKLRQDTNLVKIMPHLTGKKRILDFGGGPGGNIRLLSEHLSGCEFTLFEQSEFAVAHARKNVPGHPGNMGNTFRFESDINALKSPFDAIISIQVMEHIKNYSEVLDRLWAMLATQGVLVISVPVKGWRDRNSEHVNKFTIDSVFKALLKYSEWVSIAPRTWSKRNGRLNTAYFCVVKTEGQGHQNPVVRMPRPGEK